MSFYGASRSCLPQISAIHPFSTHHNNESPTAIMSNKIILQALPAAAQGVATIAAEAKSSNQSNGKMGFWTKLVTGIAAAGTVGGVGIVLAEDEAEHGLHAPQYPWSHDGFFSAYDHASIRRGHQVYTQVCRSQPCQDPIIAISMADSSLSARIYIDYWPRLMDSVRWSPLRIVDPSP